MNHEEIATKIADRFFIDDERMPVTRKHLIDAIAAALRLAANEAAWDGYDYGRKAGRALTWEELITPELDTEKNYGSRPKVGTP
ncbi:MAG: hypothetical protein U0638_01820 [Phycisphaerales bacterium]